MPARSELGKVLLECLRDIATLLEQGRVAAVEQQKALVANDVEALARTCAVQEEIVRRIAECDQAAADAADQLIGLAEGDGQVDTDSVAEAAGPEYAGAIAGQMEKIGELSQALNDEHEVNRHLLENGLEIIACCMRAIAADQGPNSYSDSAQVLEVRPFVLSLDRKA